MIEIPKGDEVLPGNAVERSYSWQQELRDLALSYGAWILYAALLVWMIWPKRAFFHDPVGNLVRVIHTLPQVVSSNARYIRGLFDDDIEVICTIQNDGATGDVKVFAVVRCQDDVWIQQQSVRLQSGATADLKFRFTEFMRGEAQFGVTLQEGVTRDRQFLRPIQ